MSKLDKIKITYDEIQGRIYAKNYETGLAIWENDPGPDPANFINIKRSFLERIDYWAFANLWVVPSRVSWKDTALKTVKAPNTNRIRQQVIEEMLLKIKEKSQVGAQHNE